MSAFTMANFPFNDFHWWKMFILLNYPCSRLPFIIWHSNHNPYMRFLVPKTFQNQPWEEEGCIWTKMFQTQLAPSVHGKFTIHTFQYVCIATTHYLGRFLLEFDFGAIYAKKKLFAVLPDISIWPTNYEHVQESLVSGRW